MTIVPPQRWSIKTKSLLLFAGYVAALCAVYLTFSVYLLRRETAVAHDRLQQSARMLASEVDTYIEAGRKRLATVARLPGLVYGLPTIGESMGQGHIAPWTTLHYLFFKSAVFTGGVFLVDSNGQVIWTEPPGMPLLGQSFAAAPAVAETLRDGGAHVTNALAPSVILGRPHVVVTQSIDGPNGKQAGVLCGVIDIGASSLATIPESFSTEQGRFAAIVDQHGGAIAGTETRPSAGLDFWRRENPDVLAEWTQLTHAPWRIVAGQPSATAMADIAQLQRLLIWTGAGLTLLVLAVGVPFIRSFTRSIADLIEGAEVIASGDLSRPVRIGATRDELTTLAQTFERMREEVARSRGTLEQQLREREELIRLKEEFLANVSHELRTPLNVIMGYTEMLADRHDGDLEADILRRVRAESEHLFNLLCDLMTLAGVNTGRLNLDVRPVTVADILARLNPLVQQLGRGKDVRVEWDCPDGLPALRTDPVRLEQVLSNLITNAFKFTAQGTIAIRVRHDPAQDLVVFDVADTGIGIAAEEIPHIFDEFRQVDGSMSRKYGGVGLGLALVRKLTALLQGDVTVMSRPHCGSTFSVRIPVQHA
jgi:signal transduction histidine kinase